MGAPGERPGAPEGAREGTVAGVLARWLGIADGYPKAGFMGSYAFTAVKA
jgi:hypothetical protein